MKNYLFLVLAASALFIGACSTPTANQSNANSANTAAVNSRSAEPTMTMAETLKALSAASSKKDVESIKRYLSKGTLERLEAGAKEQDKTADELLREKDGAPFPVVPELGAETATGDTGTLEVKNAETGQFEKLPFVKENGEWKVAIDVYLDNLDAAAEQAPPRP